MLLDISSLVWLITFCIVGLPGEKSRMALHGGSMRPHLGLARLDCIDSIEWTKQMGAEDRLSNEDLVCKVVGKGKRGGRVRI